MNNFVHFIPGLIIGSNELAILLAVIALIGTFLSAYIAAKGYKKTLQLHQTMQNENLAFREKMEKEQRRLNRRLQKKGIDSDLLAKARIEWLNNTKQYTSDLIIYGDNIFQSSKYIIEADLAIRNKTANNYTYKTKSSSITRCEENSEKFKTTRSILTMSYINDNDHEALLACLNRLNNLRKAEYGARAHSDLKKHEENFEKYCKTVQTFITLSNDYFKLEWEKVKHGE